LSSLVLTPVRQGNHWRVKMTWPNKAPRFFGGKAPRRIAPRFFGRFESQADAQRWIEEHCWLTTQPQKSGADESEAVDDLC
jgi:hypothetical protein